MENYTRKVDRNRDKHGSSVINATGEKDEDPTSVKRIPKLENSETQNETKHKDHKTHSPKIKDGQQENQPLNETGRNNTTHKEVNKTRHKKTNNDAKKQKAVIRQLLCEVFNISRKSEACKDMHHSKKAMIWPTKMIPWLKKVLINKLNHGLNYRMSFMDKIGRAHV